LVHGGIAKIQFGIGLRRIIIIVVVDDGLLRLRRGCGFRLPGFRILRQEILIPPGAFLAPAVHAPGISVLAGNIFVVSRTIFDTVQRTITKETITML
jgi:hypothetical protein